MSNNVYILLSEDNTTRDMDVYTTKYSLTKTQREIIQTFEPFCEEAHTLMEKDLDEAWEVFVEHAASYNVFYDVRKSKVD